MGTITYSNGAVRPVTPPASTPPAEPPTDSTDIATTGAAAPSDGVAVSGETPITPTE